MPTSDDEPNMYMQLRGEAEKRLKSGTAAAYSKWSLGVDALQLLHKLSSDPDTATDAIRLLHELQVHQVELDLQNEEMLVNEERLVEDCSRYTELYQRAPIAYFLVDFQGEIIESNRAGAELFGLPQGEMVGGRIDRFLDTESRSQLLELLQKLGEGGSTESCEITAKLAENPSRPLRVMARAFSDERSAMLVFC